MTILYDKFNNHPDIKKALLGVDKPNLAKSDNPFRAKQYTGDEYLLEFGRGDKRQYIQAMNNKKPESLPYWSGLIDEEGKIYGHNAMGIYIMKIRSKIKSNKESISTKTIDSAEITS